MDKVKDVYGYTVNWGVAHPMATVNIVIGAAVLTLVVSVL